MVTITHMGQTLHMNKKNYLLYPVLESRGWVSLRGHNSQRQE